MPTPWDLALVALFAVMWPLYTHFIDWPRHVRRVESGDPDARIRMFRKTLIEQWLLAGAAVALFLAYGRPFAAIGLGELSGWRLAVGALFPVVYVVLIVLQVPAITRSAKAQARLRERLVPLRALIPHRAAEWSWFKPLAVTAGICEELLFRGYLVWALQPWLGLYGAAGLSMVIFGLGHSYQGPKMGFRAFLAGVFMGLLALVTGSIVPGIVMHALIDLGSGYISYVAMRGTEVSESPAAA